MTFFFSFLTVGFLVEVSFIIAQVGAAAPAKIDTLIVDIVVIE